MKKITSFFFSMQTMGILILLFAFSIATATFIENDFGTSAAQAVVFKSLWFEALLGLLAINLVGNVLVNKLYRPNKLTMFVFHIAFIIILLGAAITRFISYEGVMHIRQGAASNTILTDNTFVDVVVNEGDRTVKSEESTLLSILTPGAYSDKIKVNGNSYSFHSVKFVPNAQEVVTELQSGGSPYLNLVASTGNGRQNVVLKYGESKFLETCNLQFGDTFSTMSINMKYQDNQLQIYANDSIHTLSMLTQQRAVLPPGAWYPFETKTLYQMPQVSLVITSFNPHGAVDYIPNKGKDNYMDALVVEVTSGDNTKEVVLRGGKGYEGEPSTFKMGNASISMVYGSKNIEIPFALQLVKFELERYPGSKSPSSYASEVILIDNKANEKMPYRIYMNHVLNYKGYRFFQSSYDQDELGTVLSVNHDYWGTFFTYIGYLLMALGMVLTLFNPSSRSLERLEIILLKR